MALTITYDCIACAACVEDCPNGAIGEGPGIYVIDQELCTECAGHYDTPQCAATCPVDAPVRAPGHAGAPERDQPAPGAEARRSTPLPS